MRLVLFLVLLLVPVRATAQNPDDIFQPRPTESERHAAAVVSWVTVSTNVALDLTESVLKPCHRHEDCSTALTRAVLRYGVVWGSTFALKKIVHRERPCSKLQISCGPSDPFLSFPSGHTAFAFVPVNFNRKKPSAKLEFSIPLAVTTGGLRIAGGKHYFTDVLAGAGIGLASSLIR